MLQDWLIVDTSFLFHRAFHSYAHQDPVETFFGVIEEVRNLESKFETISTVWTFDMHPYKRSEKYSDYKDNRKNKRQDDSAISEMMNLREKLRTDHLWTLGYQNSMYQDGYEADDICAGVLDELPEDNRAIIVSRDSDLFQLLSKTCAIYDPVKKELLTAKWFKAKYGISPRLWSEVKAIAGCATDKIDGMDRVTEESAVSFFKGDLKGTRKHSDILEFNKTPQYTLNHWLTQLPYPGLPKQDIKHHTIPDYATRYNALREQFNLPLVETQESLKEWRRTCIA